jgi:hypothetical protein
LGFFAIALVLSACGGEGGQDELEEAIDRAYDAVAVADMVFHAKADDGSEVWIDSENQRYRALERRDEVLLVAVGEGWKKTSYDALNNQVTTEDRRPEGAVPRIDDPLILWLEPLSALALAPRLDYLGLTQSRGRAVAAIEARSPIGGPGEFSGSFLVGRVELDPESYEPVAFERRMELPEGATPDPQSITEVLGAQPRRIEYESTELIPRADLPEDFFDVKHVEAQVITREASLQRIAEIGLAPLWLGEDFQTGRGRLILQEGIEGVSVDTLESQASLHYALAIPGAFPAPESVVVKLGLPDSQFSPPSVPAFAGTLPEAEFQATARGQEATVYRSILTPEALPCPTAACPPTRAPIYHRMVMEIEGTLVQIETFALVDQNGEEQNGYNTLEGIVALAEALAPAG